MGAIGKFILDKAIRYGIEILVKMILKWVEEQERNNRGIQSATSSNTKPQDSGWNDKHKENHLFDPRKMMK